MDTINNTLGCSEVNLLNSLKGKSLDAVLITVTPAEVNDGICESQFSLVDIVLRTVTADLLLHLEPSDDPVLRSADVYSFKITAGGVGTFASPFSGNDICGNTAGWHELPVGKDVRDIRIYEDAKSCEVTIGGEQTPVRDTSVIALTFSDSCLVLSKNAFMDNWRIQFQDSPEPDVDGLMTDHA